MAWKEGEGVLYGGESKILVYAGTSTTLAEDDLIGELVEISGIGASRETKELGGFHYKKKHKLATGQSTLNDVSFTENLTKDGLTKRKTQYKDGTVIYNACVTADGTVLYACKGTISQWGMELPDGDVCKLTYTLALEEDDCQITVPTTGSGKGA